MNILGMFVNEFNKEETDLVVCVNFTDDRSEMDAPTFTVAVQNNEITGIISDNGEGDQEFNFSPNEETIIRKYVELNYFNKK